VQYRSTRGQAPLLNFEDVVLTGLARDGGLYVPESWPHFSAGDIAAFAGLSYAELAVRVMMPFVGASIPEADFAKMVSDSYASFDHAAVTPLRQLKANDWLMELYHGPTLAFKDVALQLLGRLFDYVLKKRGEAITIVGATSGDTGSAAIEACRDRDAVKIFMLHPAGRVSEVQRRQMTTVMSSNVYNIAVEGTFDDCQAMVKAMFNDQVFRDQLNLSAVNSINWARVMAQIVYYFYASVALGGPHRKVAFSVPTGNFGDVYAGYAASRMGLPIDQLIVATNINDILSRTLNAGDYTVGEVYPTMSPSMDIQVSSNFERLLFDLYGGDGAAIRGLMADLSDKGSFRLGADKLARARGLFDAAKVTEAETAAAMADVLKASGILIDPHTAVGISAAAKLRRDQAVPMVTLATAHPAKFPAAVEKATGVHADLPERLSDLYTRDERYDTLPMNLEAVKDYVRARTILKNTSL
jgi:threonine synthase